MKSKDGRTYADKDNSPTPMRIKKALDAEFHFNFDPCPLNLDELREFDGFGGEWGNRTYVNPPWSKVGSWVKEAIRQFKQGRLVVMFLPANISSLWFCDFVMPSATEIRIVRGKITPTSTIVVIFDPSIEHQSIPKIRVWNIPILNERREIGREES